MSIPTGLPTSAGTACHVGSFLTATIPTHELFVLWIVLKSKPCHKLGRHAMACCQWWVIYSSTCPMCEICQVTCLWILNGEIVWTRNLKHAISKISPSNLPSVSVCCDLQTWSYWIDFMNSGVRTAKVLVSAYKATFHPTLTPLTNVLHLSY